MQESCRASFSQEPDNEDSGEGRVHARLLKSHLVGSSGRPRWLLVRRHVLPRRHHGVSWRKPRVGEALLHLLDGHKDGWTDGRTGKAMSDGDGKGNKRRDGMRKMG